MERLLLAACYEDEADEALRLLRAGAPIEGAPLDPQRSWYRTAATPLIVAAVKGNEDIVTLLTEWGAKVNARSNRSGATALLNAALHGHLKIVIRLESLGADIHAVDRNGWDALLAAALFGKAEVCMWLIAKSADARLTDKNNFSALTHFGLAPAIHSETRRSSADRT